MISNLKKLAFSLIFCINCQLYTMEFRGLGKTKKLKSFLAKKFDTEKKIFYKQKENIIRATRSVEQLPVKTKLESGEIHVQKQKNDIFFESKNLQEYTNDEKNIDLDTQVRMALMRLNEQERESDEALVKKIESWILQLQSIPVENLKKLASKREFFNYIESTLTQCCILLNTYSQDLVDKQIRDLKQIINDIKIEIGDTTLLKAPTEIELGQAFAVGQELIEQWGNELPSWSQLLSLPSQSEISPVYKHILFRDIYSKVHGQEYRLLKTITPIKYLVLFDMTREIIVQEQEASRGLAAIEKKEKDGKKIDLREKKNLQRKINSSENPARMLEITFYEWSFICQLIDLIEDKNKQVNQRIITISDFFILIDDYIIKTHIHEFNSNKALKKADAPYWYVDKSPRDIVSWQVKSSFYVPSLKEIYTALTYHEDKSIIGKTKITGINNPHQIKRGQRTMEFLIHYFITCAYAQWYDKMQMCNESIKLLAKEVYEIFDHKISLGYLEKRVFSMSSLDTCTDLSIQLSDKDILQLDMSNKSAIRSARALAGFSRIPNVEELQELIAENNNIITICPDIHVLKNLVFLKLSGNQLSTLPDAISKLQLLELVDCSSNDFVEFPELLFTIESLKAINFSNNKLTTLPNAFNKVPHLQLINISTNNLSIIPDSLGGLNELKELIAFDNPLRTIPDLKKLVNLISVGIDLGVYKKNKTKVKVKTVHWRAQEDAHALHEALKAVSLL